MLTAEKIGYGFNGTRKDGRKFAGVIQDVKVIEGKGTLVVFRQEDGSHRSVYVEQLNGWSASLENGMPVILQG